MAKVCPPEGCTAPTVKQGLGTGVAARWPGYQQLRCWAHLRKYNLARRVDCPVQKVGGGGPAELGCAPLVSMPLHAFFRQQAQEAGVVPAYNSFIRPLGVFCAGCRSYCRRAHTVISVQACVVYSAGGKAILPGLCTAFSSTLNLT